MRACVFVLAMTAVAQPALAREHHKSHHQHSHQHYAAQGRHHAARVHHSHVVRARVPREAIISGYAMPQSFARTDSVESAWSQSQSQSRSQASRSLQPAPQAATAAWVTEPVSARARGRAHDSALDAMIARHAAANGVPVELVHRVVTRESGYNPHARNAGALGLMQIKYATARSMGYSGSATGLFDAETNLTYAVRYLAGAYHAAGGNQSRAVALYASGYHGRAVAQRATPEVVAAATPTPTWGAQSWSSEASPGEMRSEVVMARRHLHRHRVRAR
jgi:soluble lytic murein transglycosylase-like protein